ncbi:hypothetical protein GCM10009564_28240 [Streptomyces thermogriseus]|uniref:Uncharacterized protein n=1 Tax=Streptomyces thermogriseus TaxID=75292 RepID=A0ABP4DIZ0_9ACTN
MQRVQLRQIQFGDGRQTHPAGRVDDDVDAPELGLGGVEEHRHLLFVGDVGPYGDGPAAGCGDLLDGGLGTVLAAGVSDHDGEAVGGQPGRRRTADPAGAAGDDGGAGPVGLPPGGGPGLGTEAGF